MIQNIVTGYLAGVALMLIFAAFRDPRGEVRAFAILCLAWPLTLLFIIAVNLFELTGWHFDFDKTAKMFGARRATNPQVKGWAVTVLWLEFRVFKARKA